MLRIVESKWRAYQVLLYYPFNVSVATRWGLQETNGEMEINVQEADYRMLSGPMLRGEGKEAGLGRGRSGTVLQIWEHSGADPMGGLELGCPSQLGPC